MYVSMFLFFPTSISKQKEWHTWSTSVCLNIMPKETHFFSFFLFGFFLRWENILAMGLHFCCMRWLNRCSWCRQTGRIIFLIHSPSQIDQQILKQATSHSKNHFCLLIVKVLPTDEPLEGVWRSIFLQIAHQLVGQNYFAKQNTNFELLFLTLSGILVLCLKGQSAKRSRVCEFDTFGLRSLKLIMITLLLHVQLAQYLICKELKKVVMHCHNQGMLLFFYV